MGIRDDLSRAVALVQEAPYRTSGDQDPAAVRLALGVPAPHTHGMTQTAEQTPDVFRVVDSQGTEVLRLDSNGLLHAVSLAQMTDDVPTVLTAPEVARLTGYDVSTICRWAKSGALPVVRKLEGRRGPWLFPRHVLTLIRAKRPEQQ